jgi:hypothetical protein
MNEKDIKGPGTVQTSIGLKSELPEALHALYPDRKLTLVGGGIVAYMTAYFAYKHAMAQNETIRVTIHEKNQRVGDFHDTTTQHLVPSLTFDEIVAVIPPAAILEQKASILFNEGGIRVPDVPAVHESAAYQRFIDAVRVFGATGAEHRRAVLLELGKMSMELWQEVYDEGDEELKQLLRDANFNSCREPEQPENPILHDGYRIDLIYNHPHATEHAAAMKQDYERLGSKQCRLLSPSEVVARDPSLADFCEQNTLILEDGQRVWANAQAIWRPGGYINTNVFLPLLQHYLVTKMGTYINDHGLEKNCFKVHTGRKVVGVTYQDGLLSSTIDGLEIEGYEKTTDHVKHNQHSYPISQYIMCPGEGVGTLDKMGLVEPAYARFAGASLVLSFDVEDLSADELSSLNHGMELHQPDFALAWQARRIEGRLFIGVGGTKAFYSDVAPYLDEAFAKNRNVLQLNVMNEVLPKAISKALGRDTKGHTLNQNDLDLLKQKGFATCWVGSRAVAADGFPTEGWVHKKDGTPINNTVTNTHLGSGGVSFSTGTSACALSLLGLFAPKLKHASVLEQTLALSRSTRMVGVG